MDAAIDAWVSDHAGEIVAEAQALVRIPTENRPPRGDEPAGQRFVEERVRELGADVDVFTPEDVPGIVQELGRHA